MKSAKATCTATSKRSGIRCQKGPIPGGTVCRMHGGGAPQVAKAARERLVALVYPAIAQLAKRIEDADSPALALRAATEVLDRAGYESGSKVEHSGPDGQPMTLLVSNIIRPALSRPKAVPSLETSTPSTEPSSQ